MKTHLQIDLTPCFSRNAQRPHPLGVVGKQPTYLFLSLVGVSPVLTVLAMAKNILSSGVLPSSPQLEEAPASELAPDDRPKLGVAKRDKDTKVQSSHKRNGS